jgi:hypothetical protein
VRTRRGSRRSGISSRRSRRGTGASSRSASSPLPPGRLHALRERRAPGRGSPSGSGSSRRSARGAPTSEPPLEVAVHRPSGARVEEPVPELQLQVTIEETDRFFQPALFRPKEREIEERLTWSGRSPSPSRSAPASKSFLLHAKGREVRERGRASDGSSASSVSRSAAASSHRPVSARSARVAALLRIGPGPGFFQ